MDINKNKTIFDKLETHKKYPAIRLRTNEKVRFAKYNDGTVFVYAKGYSTKGWYFNQEFFLENYKLIEVDENVEYHKRIKRALKALNSSGISAQLVSFLTELDTMSYEDRRILKDFYCEKHFAIAEYSSKPISKIDAEEWKSFWETYRTKYPFLFYTDNREIDAVDENGETVKMTIPEISTSYLYDMSEVNLKTMYFGKWANKRVKQEIKQAFADKKEYSFGVTVGWDVSFDYHPDINMAYYSEEYRGCGNGHYYVALNENVAWFVEND